MDESESPSWKGHGFTLLVFGGIVVLCSIFFVLGMLVGRNQGQRIAEAAAGGGEMARKSPAQPLPEGRSLEFPNRLTDPVPDDELQPRPTPPTTSEAAVPGPVSAAAPAEPEPPVLKEPDADKPYLQVTATKSFDEANDVLGKVRSKGFKARILAPDPASTNPYYRVLVGPYDTLAEADIAKKELQAQGYKDVFRK